MEYDCLESCNKCGGANNITPKSMEGTIVCEAETECTHCGFKDYWAYGYFQSGSEIIGKSEKYSFDNKAD